MRKRLRLLFCIILLHSSAFAQTGNPPPCTEVKLVDIAPDNTRQVILFQFIQSCERGWWVNDKGIVILHEYRNREGKYCWLLLPCIDDRYKDNPPSRAADFRGDIVLIYDADSSGHALPTVGDKTALNQCLEQIIGDRVYIRPTIRSRWTNQVMPFTNRRRMQGNRRLQYGNGGSLIIIFHPNGTVEKLLPV